MFHEEYSNIKSDWSDKMIEKERIIPRNILILQALIRRLPLNHPKLYLIKDELGKRMAGFKGEKTLDYTLSLLDTKKYYILNDLRIPCKEGFFQIDTLLITTKVIINIEVKYLAGTAYFDPIFNQLIQTKDGNESALPDPTIQVKRQESKLLDWLKKNGFHNIPVYSFVVMSNDRTIIKTSPDNKILNKIVIHRQSLFDKIKYIEGFVRNESATIKDIKKLIRTLKRHHSEPVSTVLERYGIKERELLKGVICEVCNHRPLIRKHGKWFCMECNNENSHAHIQALKDYELLIRSTINNAELRTFLNVDSSHVAKRLLQTLNLPTTGIKKGTTYILSFNENQSTKSQ
ncbi:nuclease-related domain-containing protein [Rossellomorea sp. DA94]|uniref:nuclease-related domain-containing protein n=1 Tax=Rossellomorea sp. DA94 TaxID=3038653 RepID=UPI00244C59BE|nr:nuclease-related domain-containing protein [Rossellomorea sp. DA94]WGG45099.1 nuclease-related domain-containing protein [Rossellomorea sp. DA94]